MFQKTLTFLLMYLETFWGNRTELALTILARMHKENEQKKMAICSLGRLRGCFAVGKKRDVI
jgi:hypothetical protein